MASDDSSRWFGRGRRLLKCFAAVVLLFLPGCGLNGPTSTFQELGQNANTRGFGRQFPQDPNENAFTFGVGDSLVVAVAGTPEFSGGHVIRSDGAITMPLVNDLIAAGLTTEQLATKLEMLLALYVRDPQVTVSVGKVVSKAFYVSGQNPATGGTVVKRVSYVGDITVFDAWVQMGSPSSLLDDEKHLRVIRGDAREPTVYVINMAEMYKDGLMGGNIQIRPDDIIFVPPTIVGHLNTFIAGISLPFESLFRVSRAIIELDTSIRIIQGDATFRRGSYGAY